MERLKRGLAYICLQLSSSTICSKKDLYSVAFVSLVHLQDRPTVLKWKIWEFAERPRRTAVKSTVERQMGGYTFVVDVFSFLMMTCILNDPLDACVCI